MQIGIHVTAFDGPDGPAAIGPELARIGAAAEAAGARSLSVMDHYFQMDFMAPAEDPMLEGYTTLGFLAAHTSTVQLGLLVTGATYRHPGLLAKIVATLDVLSGGPGTSASTGASACRSPRCPSGSSASRRRCRSASRCGTRRPSAPTRVATTSCPRRCARRRRSAGPGRPS